MQRGQFGPTPQRTVYADHSLRKRSLESTGRCQAILEFRIQGKRPATRTYDGKIKDEWFSPIDLQMDLAWAHRRTSQGAGGGCSPRDSGKTIIFRAKAKFFGQKPAAKNEKKLYNFVFIK